MSEAGTTAEGERATARTTPTMVQIPQDEADAFPDEFRGKAVIMYGENLTVDTDMSEFEQWVAAELARSDDDSVGRRVLSGELTYHGKTVSDDIVLHETDSFGVVYTTYNGGQLDTDGFEITETEPNADVEYFGVTVPPKLDDGEKATGEVVADDASDSLHVDRAVDVCGSLAGLAAGVLVGSAVAYTDISPNFGDEGDVDMTNLDEGASIDELIDAQA